MKPCPICSSEKTEIKINSIKDFITGNEFKICKCVECGVAYTYPRPGDLSPYYPSSYRGYNPIIILLLKLFYRRRVNNWIRNFKKPGKVLEIGCGKGFMLNIFRNKGWSVVGTERSKEAAIYAKDIQGLNVHVGDIDSLPGANEYDIIVMYNVLEHITDPAGTLHQCAKRLKPDGTLIINVHNINSWQSRFLGSSWSHLDPPRHLFHFEPKSMEYLLNKSGLKLKGIKYNSIEFDSFGWLLSSLNLMTGKYNNFAKYLMGMERITFKSFVYLVFSIFFTVPAILFSYLSYFNKSGALMQVSAKTS